MIFLVKFLVSKKLSLTTLSCSSSACGRGVCGLSSSDTTILTAAEVTGRDVFLVSSLELAGTVGDSTFATGATAVFGDGKVFLTCPLSCAAVATAKFC